MDSEKLEVNLLINIANSELKRNELELIIKLRSKFQKELDSFGIDIEEFNVERRY